MARKKKEAPGLAEIRQHLGKSQAEMGRLLGISTRSVQSYEQGWRPIPAVVQRAAALCLALKRRRKTPGQKPCWTKIKCPTDERTGCVAYQLDAGDLGWVLPAAQAVGRRLDVAGRGNCLRDMCVCRLAAGGRAPAFGAGMPRS